MIDFEKMLEEEFREKPINPLEIHQVLKTDKYGYLRGGQEHVLETWFKQRNQRDIIVKMNTGSGKTLVGLLMLQSCLNEKFGPAIYLCVDNQLIEQVVEIADECGILNVTIENGNLPVEFLNSESILITTFDKLVNGLSKFGVKDTDREEKPIGSLLVDDAHSCLKKARQAFTISLDRTQNSELCDDLFNLFKNALNLQAPGRLKDLEDKVPPALMMVPYWSWLESKDEILNILSEYREELKFQWNLLRDNLDSCYCFISHNKIEITPQCIPIEYIPSFHNAKRRFFLSATLLDDSHLIKDFGISYDAVIKPLKPKISGDIGERMIIVPSLVDSSLNTTKIVDLVLKRQKDNNIVVLTSSDKNAKKWEECGAKIARKNTIIQNLIELGESTDNFIVLVNRYDGIDLPDTSCRILIIDGKPFGESLFERFINKTRPKSKIIKSALAQKIEQGLGRSVRSGADFSVIVLIGDDLVQFLSLTENQLLLSPQTRVQIEMGLQFGKELKNEGDAEKAVLGLMDQCIERDSKWIKYHRLKLQKSGEMYLFSWDDIPGKDNEKLLEFLKENFNIEWAKTAKIKKNDDGMTIIISNEEHSLLLRLEEEQNKVCVEIDDVGNDKFTVKTEKGKLNIYGDFPIEILPIKLANKEKEAFRLYQANQNQKASKSIQTILDNYRESIDNVDNGWYLQLAAFYLYKFDKIKAMEMQLKAHNLNTLLPRPPEGVDYNKIKIEFGKQPDKIIKWIKKHTEANALIISADILLNKLDFGVPFETFEDEFANLAEIIGFESQRPEKEYGEGPDVLWHLSDGTYLIISAKNEATSTTISKKYADNLGGSLVWFKEKYPNFEGIPVMTHPSRKLASDAYISDNAMALKPNGLKSLVKNVRGFTTALSSKSPELWELDEVNKLIHEYYLDPKNIKEKYLLEIKKS